MGTTTLTFPKKGRYGGQACEARYVFEKASGYSYTLLSRQIHKETTEIFGLIGASLFIPGIMITVYLGILRLFGGIGLANRPLLFLGILLMVFGIQTFSVGL